MEDEMLYTKLTLWMHNGKIWHSLSNPLVNRDLSMGILFPSEVEKMLSWAKRSNMEIENNLEYPK